MLHFLFEEYHVKVVKSLLCVKWSWVQIQVIGSCLRLHFFLRPLRLFLELQSCMPWAKLLTKLTLPLWGAEYIWWKPTISEVNHLIFSSLFKSHCLCIFIVCKQTLIFFVSVFEQYNSTCCQILLPWLWCEQLWFPQKPDMFNRTS